MVHTYVGVEVKVYISIVVLRSWYTHILGYKSCYVYVGVEVMVHTYVTGFGEIRLFTGWIKIDFVCQISHLLSLVIARTKHERYTVVCFNAMTLNSQSLAIIFSFFFFLFLRKGVLSPLLGGA